MAPSPKETPTPAPSVNECTVITPTNVAALTASAPCRVAKVRCLRWASAARVPTMNNGPTAAPTTVRPIPLRPPSYRSAALAAAIIPAARASPTPSHE